MASEPVYRSYGDWDFVEFQGVITSLPAAHIEDHRRVLERDGSTAERWGLEAFLNHEHPASSQASSREGVRSLLDMAAEMGEALQHAWPDRHFHVFCVLGSDYLTFYQADADADAPATEVSESRPAHSVWSNDPDLRWCDACGGDQAFTPVAVSDPEFPMLAWACCRVCGHEMVATECRVTFRVGPGIQQDFVIGGYVPQPHAPTWKVANRQV